MQNLEVQEKIREIETKIFDNISLLELAQGYCIANFEKSVEISTLQTVLDILLKQQKELAKDVDSIAMA